MQTLLLAHERKRISGIPLYFAEMITIVTCVFFSDQVFVTEARPRGLGYGSMRAFV